MEKLYSNPSNTAGIPQTRSEHHFTHFANRIRIKPMNSENTEETQKIHPDESVQSSPPGIPPSEVTQAAETPASKELPLGRLMLIGFGVLIIVLALSAFLGYRGGIRQRTQFESTQVAQAVKEQFDLGLKDMQEGKYETARQRFEYIIRLDPSYPGITDKLAEVLLVLNATATPTAAPTGTSVPVTPTPDVRGEEEMLAQAKDLLKNKEWSDAIEILENLRKKNPGFKAIEVDDMLYLALRNLGVHKIGLGQLESGIYDLTLAEGFGPLDAEANNWRTWARYYITGASFWEVDWGQAVYYFGQVASMTPNMHDGTGWTASKRYLEALLKYANWLEDHKKWCDAETIYQKAYDISGDESLLEVIEQVTDKCE